MIADGDKSIPWRGRRPRAALLSFLDAHSVTEEVQRLRPIIEAHADIVWTDLSGKEDLSRCTADLAFVFGGDGSILRSARQMGDGQIPVIGVNLGRLGFLADLTPEEVARVFPEIAAGKCQIIDHIMFMCIVSRDGQVIHRQLGLNETAILGGPPFSMLDIDLYVDSQWVTTYSCDGLIVSTPIGSTAHSLSAGGPILRKSLQAFVISPISPHTLTMRPVVDTADRQYAMEVRSPHAGTTVVVDGRPLHTLLASDRVTVSRAESTFKLVEAGGHGDYRTLREKLGWGGGLRQRNADRSDPSP